MDGPRVAKREVADLLLHPVALALVVPPPALGDLFPRRVPPWRAVPEVRADLSGSTVFRTLPTLPQRQRQPLPPCMKANWLGVGSRAS